MITSSAKTAISPRSFVGYVVDGAQVGVGYAAVNLLGNLEYRIGLGAVMNQIPGTALRALAGYAVKIFNVGIVYGLSSMLRFSPRWRKNLRAGGIANLGVSLLMDVAGYLGEPGAMLASNLAGVGDYTIMGPPGATSMNPYGYAGMSGMGNYMTAGGVPLMNEYMSSAMSPYGSPADGLLGY